MKELPELISSWRKQAQTYLEMEDRALPRSLIIDAILILDGVFDSAYLAARGTSKWFGFS